MLSGRIALVTGGARGIGAACSKILSNEGAKVIVADLKAESCDATLKVCVFAHAVMAKSACARMRESCVWCDERNLQLAFMTIYETQIIFTNTLCSLHRQVFS